jgi:hypothetical protein
MPARVSWQELLKARNQGASTDGAQGGFSIAAKKQKGDAGINLTLHMLLKRANPSWSGAEFRAAKQKLKTIGIESFSGLEEVLLEGRGILNNRLRDNGLKAFSTTTLDRIMSTIVSEQEKLRQAAEEAESLTVAEQKMLHAEERAKAEVVPIESRLMIKPLPMMGHRCTSETQGPLCSQLPNLRSNKTLYMLLKNANPGWTTKDLEGAMRKLQAIGIVTYMELEEVLLQGRGILNRRLRDNGLKIFAPSTLQRLKNALKPETPRSLHRSPHGVKKSFPVVHSFDLGSPSDMESMCLETPSRRDSDNESNDICMRWYDDSDTESNWSTVEHRLSEMSSACCKVKIAPLDLSKAVHTSVASASQYSSRTESTSAETSPPASPFASRVATFFAIGTP